MINHQLSQTKLQISEVSSLIWLYYIHIYNIIIGGPTIFLQTFNIIHPLALIMIILHDLESIELGSRYSSYIALGAKEYCGYSLTQFGRGKLFPGNTYCFPVILLSLTLSDVYSFSPPIVSSEFPP